MWDGCVEIVLGFDTKDGYDWFAVGSRLRGGLRTVVGGLRFPMVGAGLESGKKKEPARAGPFFLHVC